MNAMTTRPLGRAIDHCDDLDQRRQEHLTETQMLLAVTALSPGPEEGRRLPLQVALARLRNIAREVRQEAAQ